MEKLQQAFEQYARSHPEVTEEMLAKAGEKYTNEVIELHWQTWQACAKWMQTNS